jgi:hypothetical protein
MKLAPPVVTVLYYSLFWLFESSFANSIENLLHTARTVYTTEQYWHV